MEEEPDHIGELEKRLYARDPELVPQRRFGILRPERQNVTSVWGQTTVTQEKPVRKSTVTPYRRFFIFSLIFFLLALGVAVYSIYRGSLTLSSNNVNVSILGNAFVAAGDTLPIQVEVANSNSAALLNAQINLSYPKGVSDGSNDNTAQIMQNLGTIAAGQSKSQAFSVVLYGQQGSTQTITATLSYQLKNSTAIFQKNQTFSVLISSSPLTLTVTSPTSTAANQTFELTIHNVFNSNTPLQDVIERVDYPTGFVFSSATPAPIGGNDVWSLGNLQSGSDTDIVIQGKLTGQENEQKSFRIYVGTPADTTDTAITTVYNSALQTITLTNPFIDAQINANDISTDIIPVPVGDPVNGTVSWVNNSGATVTDPTFTLQLNGTSYDPTTVSVPGGYYDDTSNTITWTGDSDPDISSIAAGQTGQLSFSFSPKTGDTSDIGMDLSVQGTLPDSNNQQQSVSDIDVKTIRFSGHLQFASQALYSVGPFKNTGPFPPEQGKTTTYTITWTALPSENPLTNVAASAILPEGVTWLGNISPSSQPVTYDPGTKTVTWSVGVLPSAATSSQSQSVSFQVSVKPPSDAVGTPLSLLGETTVVGTDATANVPLTVTRPALTSELPTDPAYSSGDDLVVK
jgi:hypothetical protein